jgi:hypothetical protein
MHREVAEVNGGVYPAATGVKLMRVILARESDALIPNNTTPSDKNVESI